MEAISDFLPEEGVFPYSGNVFFNESFIPAIEERFFLVETVYYTWEFFPPSRTCHWYELKPFLKGRPYLVENDFLASRNHFLPLPQIFFKKFFIPASGNTFSGPEEKVLFFT